MELDLIKKLRELTQLSYLPEDRTVINQSEIAVIMKTFGITWNDIKQPSRTFCLYDEMKLTESDLKQELHSIVTILNRAKEKNLCSKEREMKWMLQGFLQGVKFFNPHLSYEFSLMARKSYIS